MSSSAGMKASTSRRQLLLPLALLLVLTPTPAPGFGIGDIVKSIIPQVSEAVSTTRDVEMLGHVCTVYRRGIIRSFELYYSVTYTCPGWTSIRGRSDKHQNPQNAEVAAVEDFVKQAVAKKVMTEKQAAAWL